MIVLYNIPVSTNIYLLNPTSRYLNRLISKVSSSGCIESFCPYLRCSPFLIKIQITFKVHDSASSHQMYKEGVDQMMVGKE